MPLAHAILFCKDEAGKKGHSYFRQDLMQLVFLLLQDIRSYKQQAFGSGEVHSGPSPHGKGVQCRTAEATLVSQSGKPPAHDHQWAYEREWFLGQKRIVP